MSAQLIFRFVGAFRCVYPSTTVTNRASLIGAFSTQQSLASARLYSTPSQSVFLANPSKCSLLRNCIASSLGGISLTFLTDYVFCPDVLTQLSFVRCARAAIITFLILSDYKLTAWFSGKTGLSGSHKRCARKLLQLAESNKGVYIKLGQHIASLDYLLPTEYTSTMKILHRSAPCSSLRDVKHVVQMELDCRNIDEIFCDFDSQPAGTASLAQVHFATLRSTGERVALKVQHKEVRKLSSVDLRIIAFFVSVIKRVFPEVKFDWLSDIMNETLPTELDFIKEGRNSVRTAKLLCRNQPDHPDQASKKLFYKVPSQDCLSSFLEIISSLVTSDATLAHSATSPAATFGSCIYEVEFHVPLTYWDLSTSRLLVMEKCDGCPIDDVQQIRSQGIHPLVVSKALAELHQRMIFEFGVIHADLHPGNILVKKVARDDVFTESSNNRRRLLMSSIESSHSRPTVNRLRISLIDHGLYCQINEEFQYHYALFWRGLLSGNQDMIKTAGEYFGVSDVLGGLLACIVSGGTQESIQKVLHQNPKSEELYNFAEEIQQFFQQAPQYFVEITQVLQSIPKQLILILKTNDLVRSIQRTLELHETVALIPVSRACLRVTTERKIQQSSYISALRERLVYWWCLAKLAVAEWLLDHPRSRIFYDTAFGNGLLKKHN